MEQEERTPRRGWRTAAVLALGAVVGVMLLAPPAGAHFLPSISHIWHHLKPKVKAQINQSASRVAYQQASIDVPVAGSESNLATVSVKIPGPSGGTRFVKVDAQIVGYVSSVTTCPCQAIYHVRRGGHVSQPAYTVLRSLAGGFDEDSAAITYVAAVPTGTTQTFRITGREFTGSETISGLFALSAITGNFGHNGGSVLRVSNAGPGQ